MKLRKRMYINCTVKILIEAQIMLTLFCKNLLFFLIIKYIHNTFREESELSGIEDIDSVSTTYHNRKISCHVLSSIFLDPFEKVYFVLKEANEMINHENQIYK